MINKRKKPLVSVITATYNGANHIQRLLESILSQDYPSIELVAIDDGSTDDTANILSLYKRKFEDRGYTINLLSQDNRGPAKAFALGIKEYTGEYLTFIADDDFLNPSSIRKRVDYLEKNRECDMVYTKVDTVNEDNIKKVTGVREIKNFPTNMNLFINMLLEKDYQYGGIAHLIRSSYFLTIHPRREISDFKSGQNIQIFLPMYYKGKVGYLEESCATVVERKDSHSREQRSEEEWKDRYRDICNIFIDTLNKIDMPKQERDNYIMVVKARYEDKFYINDLKAELSSLRGIKRSAMLLIDNIKRRLTRKKD